MTCQEFMGNMRIDPEDVSREVRLATWEHYQGCLPCRAVFEFMHAAAVAKKGPLPPEEKADLDAMADADHASQEGK